MLAELNEILVQLRHFCGTFRRFSGNVPYYSLFFSGGRSNVDVAHTGVIWAVPRFFSVSLFIACIVLVAQDIVQLNSERAVFCM